MSLSPEDVVDALQGVIDPELGRSVVDLGMVRDLRVDGGAVSLTIMLTAAASSLRAGFEEQVVGALSVVSGVARISLSFDAMSDAERSELAVRLRPAAGGEPGVSVDSSTRVLLVASGKGGVGKSSVAANLAAAFALRGRRTGILDADVYGFSIPRMLGIQEQPVVLGDLAIPPMSDGVKVMSVGFFLGEGSLVIWRGPMLHRALQQFLSDVYWGDLDVLVVDMPPGTGDVALTLGQFLPRSEVLVVTTPQQVAQEVALRAVEMARKGNMTPIGVVENMSYLEREDGSREELFGSGGGDRLAEAAGLPLLARIPFDPQLGACADAGSPIVREEPGRPGSRALFALADALFETPIAEPQAAAIP